MTEPVSVLSAVLTAITSIVTSAVGWMSSFLHSITVTGNELLLVFTVIPIVGLGIGILRRMLKVD